MKRVEFYKVGSTGIRRPLRQNSEFWAAVSDYVGGGAIWLGAIVGFWLLCRYFPL